jgi:hypothetical protein
MSWRQKANDIIAAESRAAYLAANTPKRKRHVPYRIPEIAESLVRALDSDDEHECKRLFIVYSTGALSLI